MGVTAGADPDVLYSATVPEMAESGRTRGSASRASSRWGIISPGAGTVSWPRTSTCNTAAALRARPGDQDSDTAR